MRFRLPRPLHGWREFAYEIIIVVVGVLLALGGAQFLVTSQLRLRELLSRVEQYNEVTPGNYDYIVTIAQPLGIHPIRDAVVHHVPSDMSFCQPLFQTSH